MMDATVAVIPDNNNGALLTSTGGATQATCVQSPLTHDKVIHKML